MRKGKRPEGHTYDGGVLLNHALQFQRGLHRRFFVSESNGITTYADANEDGWSGTLQCGALVQHSRVGVSSLPVKDLK